ncbi:pyruvate dehydrogenase (acetyl-transferring) E1 component subunit alpha [Vagococcus penaei]|uniref:Pyruvate dehydrogenase E1 component subunit alpha n=1 Tax=Vagococcus penaei TaxID=633807 RepID=A0A1Q2D4E8_9ENTE|nr:pyruvate dehydrogenase (acetyl-transferring) E1 component subunit alpha [Vagococcus penaei]AQP53258.1 pyruvate dehydrogenase (acetyl-transferring) E1 component subunit alpha [Vagococcus penaei]RSU04027.1 pyruvate dehydrogenase (acetyl-transferring) E1 component subunit alpha [Vagococcus penaei]
MSKKEFKLFDDMVTKSAEAVPFVQILNEEGKLVNKGAKSSLTDEELVALMKNLVWGRTVNERLILAGRQGRIGNLPPSEGQEASQLATLFAMKKEDFLMPTYRDVIPLVSHGMPMKNAVLWYRGHVAANILPENVNGLPAQVIIGSQYVQAAGLGMAYKRDKKDQVVMTYIGDGGSSQGDFYEGINFAGVFESQAVFIVQNNQYGISVPREMQTKAKTLAQKAAAAGIPGIQVDGMDPLALYEVTKMARDYTMAGNGPVLIETLTYRFGPHTLSDDPTRYRTQEELESWLAKDYMIRMKKYLGEKGLWSEELEQEVIDATIVEMNDALDAADAEPAQKVSQLLANVFEVPTPRIQKEIEMYRAKEEK